MLCTFCNTARLDNEAPCPYCGAPSPLAQTGNAGMPATNINGVWGGVNTAFSPVQTMNQAPQAQFPFQPMPTDQVQFPFTSVSTNQAQGMQMPLQNAGQPEQQNMLPVPYQPAFQQGMPAEGGALVPYAGGQGALVPMLPEQEGAAIYVPPMYTKPRPIIPRYRAISGLLSVLIVFTFLCVGTGYYAKASGKLSFLHQLYGGAPPPNIQAASTPTLPDPPATPQTGPAFNVINSATTSSTVDPNTHIALQPANAFAPGQTINLTYTVHPDKIPGTVTIKWYTNGTFYRSTDSQATTKNTLNGLAQMVYTQPTEGTVEIYWNNQLAIRLFFVVRK